MSTAAVWLPITVLLPLGVATLSLAVAHWLPSRVTNLVAILTALGVAVLCALIAQAALDRPILYWFGGWTPHSSDQPGVVLGISFLADSASAAIAAFTGILFAATFTFAWGYFDELHSHFQILMLLFLAAIVGFCLTHDLFNLFVWFELMSIAAFSLTAYPLGKSSLEGAFNFYHHQCARELHDAGRPRPAVRALRHARFHPDGPRGGPAGFRSGAQRRLLPSCSSAVDQGRRRSVSHVAGGRARGGAEPGLSDLLRRYGQCRAIRLAQADRAGIRPRPPSYALGPFAATVAWYEHGRHRRCHGLGAEASQAPARLFYHCSSRHHADRRRRRYTVRSYRAVALHVGHGLAKGTLFMIAGILLALRSSQDEIALCGKARDLWPAGVVMGLAGFILGGLPYGLLHHASDLIEIATPEARAAIVVATALTGAAVVRAAARIFAGWSGVPGIEFIGPTELSREKGPRPLWLMLLPCILLLTLALVPGSLVTPLFSHAVVTLFERQAQDGAALPPESSSIATYAPIVIMIVIVVYSLLRRRATSALARMLFRLEQLPFRATRVQHWLDYASHLSFDGWNPGNQCTYRSDNRSWDLGQSLSALPKLASASDCSAAVCC